jgi:SAM-dependent methyltransferase
MTDRKNTCASEPASFLHKLREKWSTIPATADVRSSTARLLSLEDRELLTHWEAARVATVETGPLNYLRGWYQLLYRDWCRGKKIMDIGCGLGIDGIHFAEQGASVTFVDIVEGNVELVRRICRLKGIEQRCSFHVMRDVDGLAALPTDFDAVMGFGSLMNAPYEVMKPEFDALVARLRPDLGRFIMHSYPKARWEREGSLPFDQWGEKTDGPGTPWAEWYDVDKLIDALRPARFEPVFYCEYRRGDMNCIDLVRSAPFHDPLPSGAVRISGGPILAKAETFWPGANLAYGPGGLKVRTGSPCWSYAAEMPLELKSVPPGKRFRLGAKVRVQEGEIGIGILRKDENDFLVELRFDRRADWEQFSVEIASLDDAKSIIIRNTDRDHRCSDALIEDISLYSY